MICEGKTSARIEEVTKLFGLRGGKYSAVSSSMNKQLLDVHTGFYCWKNNKLSKKSAFVVRHDIILTESIVFQQWQHCKLCWLYDLKGKKTDFFGLADKADD